MHIKSKRSTEKSVAHQYHNIHCLLTIMSRHYPINDVMTVTINIADPYLSRVIGITPGCVQIIKLQPIHLYTQLYSNTLIKLTLSTKYSNRIINSHSE